MLDVTPDEALEMNKKRRLMRWDARKRKFVKVGQDSRTRESCQSVYIANDRDLRIVSVNLHC